MPFHIMSGMFGVIAIQHARYTSTGHHDGSGPGRNAASAPTLHAESKLATLAFGPVSPVYAIGMIADLKGYFKDEGVTLKLLTGNAGTFGRQTLAAGQVMFAHGDASHPLQLTARGKPCKILLATEMVASYASIVVRKDLYDSGITSLDKLAAYKRPDGAKPIVAATAIGSGTWVFGTYVFEARGLADKGELGSGRRAEHHVPSLETKAI